MKQIEIPDVTEAEIQEALAESPSATDSKMVYCIDGTPTVNCISLSAQVATIVKTICDSKYKSIGGHRNITLPYEAHQASTQDLKWLKYLLKHAPVVTWVMTTTYSKEYYQGLAQLLSASGTPASIILYRDVDAGYFTSALNGIRCTVSLFNTQQLSCYDNVYKVELNTTIEEAQKHLLYITQHTSVSSTHLTLNDLPKNQEESNKKKVHDLIKLLITERNIIDSAVIFRSDIGKIVISLEEKYQTTSMMFLALYISYPFKCIPVTINSEATPLSVYLERNKDRFNERYSKVRKIIETKPSATIQDPESVRVLWARRNSSALAMLFAQINFISAVPYAMRGISSEVLQSNNHELQESIQTLLARSLMSHINKAGNIVTNMHDLPMELLCYILQCTPVTAIEWEGSRTI